jgi:RNA polymerase sigma factor (sigma-70 family)
MTLSQRRRRPLDNKLLKMEQPPTEGLSPEQFALLFQNAYNDHGRKLRYYAMKFLGDPHDAEDVVAGLFAHLWAKGAVFNHDKLNWPYLQRAVRNACLDWLLRKARFESFDSSSGAVEGYAAALAAIPSHEEDLIRTEVVAQIAELIERLPPQTRRVIRKLYYEGMEPGEAADDMRLALSTIYNSRRSGFGQLLYLLRLKNIRAWWWATLIFIEKK